MAIQLQSQNDFENSGLYGGAVQDLNDIVFFNRQDYTTTHPGLHSFTSVYLVPFGGMTVGATSFAIDVTAQQIYMIRDGDMKVIAGMYGFTGFRNGTGSQALFGMGGFQEAYGYCVDSAGALYVTDSKNGKIRKLVEEMDETWTVSTFATYTTNTVACDADDNIWTSSGANLIKILPGGGGTETYPTGVSNINQIVTLGNGHILIVTRNNAWDIIYNFDQDTEIATRVAGMNDAEVAAYQTANGFILVDGPALNGATYHSPQFAYYNSDGSEIWMGGGDERQLRRYLSSSGRVDSLFPDGQFYETQVRIGGSTNDNPTLPFFMVSPGGKQTSGTGTGYPWDFGRSGGVTAALRVVPVTVADPSDINNAQFVSQSITTTMDAGQQYLVTVTMRNVGNTTWSEALLYRLGSQNPQDNTIWGWPFGNRLKITGTVPPNTNYTFSVTVTAPALGGLYNFQTRMVRDGVEWFGALSTNVGVTVTGASPPTVIPMTLNLKL